MKTQKFNDAEREEWLAARRGKITGSKLKDVYSKRDPDKWKIEVYALIAERLGLPPDTEETSMERGKRLESDALDRFAEETGKKVDKSLLIWMREDEESIAVSPDAVVMETDETEAVEAKCLSSARHIEAYLKKHNDILPDFDCVPSDYKEQAVQYFVVNDKLQKLFFVFYDPRFALFRSDGSVGVEENKNAKLDFFYLEVWRRDVQPLVEEYLVFERKILAKIRTIVNQLTF